jgi:hypothetical protein
MRSSEFTPPSTVKPSAVTVPVLVIAPLEIVPVKVAFCDESIVKASNDAVLSLIEAESVACISRLPVPLCINCEPLFAPPLPLISRNA